MAVPSTVLKRRKEEGDKHRAENAQVRIRDSSKESGKALLERRDGADKMQCKKRECAYARTYSTCET